MVTIVTREAGDPDLAARLADLHERSAVLAYAHIFDTPFPRAEARERWRSYRGRLALATDAVGADLLGFAAWSGDSLDALYVDPDASGRGIGRRLLKAATGARRLWVIEANTRARSFYERSGWVASGVTRPGYPGAPELEYVRTPASR